MSTAQAPQQHPPLDEPEKGEKAPAGLTAKGKARWAEIRARNAMIRAIQGETWGSSLSKRSAAAFAEFMRRFKLDISEIDNLGGRPYRNGRYYMRKTAELAAAGRVEWYKGRHLGPDKRLEEFAKAGEQWAIDERWDRVRECIRLGVPADAVIVYVVTVKMKELAVPTEGVKWWSPGRTKNTKHGKVNADPVGDENPVTSTETRAWRRAGRLYAAEIPELYQDEEEMEFAAGEIGKAVIAEADEAEGVEISHEAPAVATSGEAPYTEGPIRSITEGPAQPISVTSSRPSADVVERAKQAATAPNPYAEEEPDFSNAPDL